MTNGHFVIQKWGFSNILEGGEIIFSSFYGSDDTWHTPKPAYKAKLKNIHFSKSYKGTLITKWQMVISWSKNGVFPTFWGEGKLFFLVSMVRKVHNTPLNLPIKWIWKILIFEKVIKVPPSWNDKWSFRGPKMGFFQHFGGRGNYFFWFLWFRRYITHPWTCL